MGYWDVVADSIRIAGKSLEKHVEIHPIIHRSGSFFITWAASAIMSFDWDLGSSHCLNFEVHT